MMAMKASWERLFGHDGDGEPPGRPRLFELGFERESESRDEANVDQNVENNLQFWKRDTVIQVPCSHVSCKTDK